MGIEFFGKQVADAMLAFRPRSPNRRPRRDRSTDADPPAEESRPFDPAEPLLHQTGAAGFAVEFIGANAEERTRRALGGDDANGDDAGLEAARRVVQRRARPPARGGALPSSPGGEKGSCTKLVALLERAELRRLPTSRSRKSTRS